MILKEGRNCQESTRRRKRVRTILRAIKLTLFRTDIHTNKNGDAYQPRDNPHPILSSTTLD
jgi:hypothetical protein